MGSTRGQGSCLDHQAATGSRLCWRLRDPALAHRQCPAAAGRAVGTAEPSNSLSSGSNSTGRESRKEAQAGSTSRGTRAGCATVPAAAADLGESQGKPWVHAVTQDLAASQALDGVTIPGVCSLVCAELAGSCSAAARWDPAPGGGTAGSARSNPFG